MGLKLIDPVLRRLLRFGLLLIVAVSVSLTIAHSSSAQFSLPTNLGQRDRLSPPPGVNRYGNIETMAVRSPLSNQLLFTIASPTVYNRQPEALGEQQPVEIRVKEIQAKLLLLLRREMNPETLMFGVSRLNKVTVISVRDDQYPRPLVLASVTRDDADFNGLPIDELAEQWRQVLEDDLRKGLAKLPQDRQRIYKMLVGFLIITSIVMVLKYFLAKTQRKLRQQKQDLSTTDLEIAADANPEKASPVDTQQADAALIDINSMEAEPIALEAPPTTLRAQIAHKRAALTRKLQRDFTLDRRLTTLDFIQWGSFWLLILAWYGGAAWVFAVSPYLLADSLGFLNVLLGLLTVWFVTGLAIRLSHRLINYFSVDREGLDIGDFLASDDAQRRQIRASTIASAAKGLMTVVIILTGFLSALSVLGLPTASVVAIGSLAGLAITFGSQNLVKDLVNGFFILAEDQYAIGDVIDVETASGLVENLNMRVTQIRSVQGELVTIPNSAITQVKNLTRNWSRVAFSIDIAYQTPPAEALKVLRSVAQELYDDPKWHDKILAPPDVLGIDQVSHIGITITIWIQTAPAQQWAVGREFRLRVREAIAAHGIEIGTPKQIYAQADSKHDHPSKPESA